MISIGQIMQEVGQIITAGGQLTAVQLREGILLILLAVCSVQDIRTQQVFIPLPAAGILLGICLTAFCGDLTWLSVMGGATVGGAMILFGCLSHGAFGSGDGWVLAACGSLLGAVQSITLLMTASMIAMAVSAFLLLAKRRRRHDTIPFVPFLLAACLLQIGTVH